MGNSLNINLYNVNQNSKCYYHVYRCIATLPIFYILIQNNYNNNNFLCVLQKEQGQEIESILREYFFIQMVKRVFVESGNIPSEQQ